MKAGLVVKQFEIRKELSFRSAALPREESAVSLLAASRFLADTPGFGMTILCGFQIASLPTPPSLTG
jgi:hypothetical protein